MSRGDRAGHTYGAPGAGAGFESPCIVIAPTAYICIAYDLSLIPGIDCRREGGIGE